MIKGTVVVLGDTGMLGQSLMAEASHRGLNAVGISRRKRGGVDLAGVESLGPVLSPLAPALVINAAAMTNLEDCERDPGAAYAINARLPALLAGCNVRWVQVSTDHYFSGSENTSNNENAPVKLLNEYARTKYAGEAFARLDADCLVIRTNIVGFRGWIDQPTFVEWALTALTRGNPFDAYRDVWTSSIEVGQFSKALFDLVERGARGLVNVAARETVSKATFIAALAAAVGLDATLARVTNRPSTARPARANAMGLNVAKAEHLLGYQLPDTAAVISALVRNQPRTSEHAQA